MTENLLVSVITTAICVAVQSVVVSFLLRLLVALGRKKTVRFTTPGASALLISVLLVMLAGNLLQIALWALVFSAYGEFRDFATAFYHSTVNFATLGYGDIVMSEDRRLLGALEAVNGALMLGLTASILFAVLQLLLKRARVRDGEGD
jgi:hypothetical protein